jgi:tetraacyldisaccharide 4'-kinase
LVDAQPKGDVWIERLARRGGAVELLRLPSVLFGAIVRARRALYDAGLAPRARLPVPVVSVGNLTTGGTGKTPMCAWLARELKSRGYRPGFLSRGYRAEPGQPNDEARLLARLCPDVPHVQDKLRARGGAELVERGVDAIVLDDGFQHRQLHRDLDLVLIDATRPWGLPRGADGAALRALLPRGLMREPASSLARADAVVLTRCEQVSASMLASIESELGALVPGKLLARSAHTPRAWRENGGRELPLEALRGRRVDLISALGNPQAFEASVRALGVHVEQHRKFPDHHEYTAQDLEGLAGTDKLFVTSGKDGVKLERLGAKFVSLEIELTLERGAHVMAALLDSLPRAGHATRALHEGLHG